MTRRGWFKRLAAAVVVTATSPTYLIHRPTWHRIKSITNGWLTESQAKRFISLILDQSVISSHARVVRFSPYPANHTRERIIHATGAPHRAVPLGAV